MLENYKHILSIAGLNTEKILDIENRWNESHRFYHTPEHLFKMLDNIERDSLDYFPLEKDHNTMILAAIFHDVIYDPKRTDNEDKSIEYFLSVTKSDPDLYYKDKVIQLINLTKKRELSEEELNDDCFILFWKYDNEVLTGCFNELLDYENKIFKEYQWVDYDEYKAKRIEFLESNLGKFDNDVNLKALVTYINKRKPKVGVYCGSFWPFHFGHLDILKKSEQIFDKVIVAYGVNPDKSYSGRIVPEKIKYNCVKFYEGLTTDFIATEEEKGQEVTLIRGLRNGADLDYEDNQNQYMKDMKPDLKIIFIRCDSKFEHISSSGIRSLYRYGEEKWKKYVPN